MASPAGVKAPALGGTLVLSELRHEKPGNCHHLYEVRIQHSRSGGPQIQGDDAHDEPTGKNFGAATCARSATACSRAATGSGLASSTPETTGFQGHHGRRCASRWIWSIFAARFSSRQPRRRARAHRRLTASAVSLYARTSRGGTVHAWTGGTFPLHAGTARRRRRSRPRVHGAAPARLSASRRRSRWVRAATRCGRVRRTATRSAGEPVGRHRSARSNGRRIRSAGRSAPLRRGTSRFRGERRREPAGGATLVASRTARCTWRLRRSAAPARRAP